MKSLSYGILSCGSSSSGNSVIFLRFLPGQCKAKGVMLDSGVSGIRVNTYISEAEKFLKKKFDTPTFKIDVEAIIVTHMHGDHSGTAHILAEALQPKQFYFPDMFDANPRGYFRNWDKVLDRLVSGYHKVEKKGVPVFLYSDSSVRKLGGKGVQVEDLDGVLRNYSTTEKLGKEVSSERLDKHSILVTPHSIETADAVTEADQIVLPSGIRIQAVEVAHDTLCYSLLVDFGDFALSYTVDMGSYNSEVVNLCKKADALVLEFNYDEDLIESELLETPADVRERSKGNYGHLSNLQSADFLKDVLSGPAEAQAVITAHRGGETNSLDAIGRAWNKALGKKSTLVKECLPRKNGCLVLLHGENSREGYKITRTSSRMFMVPR